MAKARIVKDVDRGLRRLLRRVAGKGDEITVGVHAADGDRPKGDTTLADIAVVHEFGAPAAGIPPRSFIRDWADETADAKAKQIRAVGKAVLSGKIDSADQALDRLGLRWVGEVQRRIAAGIEPPLKPETIERKGSSKPLIDKGQLRSSISYAVNGRLEPSKLTTADDRKRKAARKKAVKAAKAKLERAIRRAPGLARRSALRASKAVKRTANRAGKRVTKAARRTSKFVERLRNGTRGRKK